MTAASGPVCARRQSSQQEGQVAIEFTGMDLDSFILLKNVIVYNSESEEKILEEFNNYMKLRSQG